MDAFEERTVEALERLRDERRSVISSSAWGGRVCKRLGLEPRSPFVGTEFYADGFLKILEDPNHYLALTPRFVCEHRQDYYWGGFLFALGDVRFVSKASRDCTEAQRRWCQGVELLDLDKAFVQLHTFRPEDELRLASLEGYARRACFVPYESEVPTSVHVPRRAGFYWYLQEIEANAKEADATTVALLSGACTPKDYERALRLAVARCEGQRED